MKSADTPTLSPLESRHSVRTDWKSYTRHLFSQGFRGVGYE